MPVKKTASTQTAKVLAFKNRTNCRREYTDEVLHCMMQEILDAGGKQAPALELAIRALRNHQISEEERD